MAVFSVSDSIARSLSSLGSKYSIYTDPVAQGTDLPCFFIKTLSVSNEPCVGNRCYLKQKFLLRYLPADPLNAYNECLNIAEKLYDLLAFIKDDNDIIHGTGMRHEFTDNSLNFYVDYNCFTKTIRCKSEAMSDIKQLFSEKGT